MGGCHRVLGRAPTEPLGERRREPLVGRLHGNGDERAQGRHEELGLVSLLAVLAAQGQRKPHDDVLHLELNRVAFISIVHNLLDNALRYGNDRGRVVVTLTADPQAGTLRVADDGPGIGADDRERIFERFYRCKGHEATGTGLGLAIVGKAVHAMGAAIHLEDGVDRRGVAFVIRFPRPSVPSLS